MLGTGLKVTGPIATFLFQSHGSLVFQHGEIRLWHKEPYFRANTSQAIYKYLVHPQYSWDLRAYHTIELVLYYGGLQITVCTLSATKRHNILLDTHPHPFLQLFITAIYFLLKRHSQCFVLGGGMPLGSRWKQWIPETGVPGNYKPSDTGVGSSRKTGNFLNYWFVSPAPTAIYFYVKFLF